MPNRGNMRMKISSTRRLASHGLRDGGLARRLPVPEGTTSTPQPDQAGLCVTVI